MRGQREARSRAGGWSPTARHATAVIDCLRRGTARRGEVLGALGALFGDAARAPRDYLEADWAADPWSAGCVASTPPGALAAGAVWRGAHGRLHLAGTEAAVRWPGYMEGAIEAGERAAADALAALAAGP